ncbi:unnamed protein product [Leptosia nina]|uniref:Uncharacterized protein n=1 Tax=Leptosia nina TaxID=320188 RepID=A0AAV1JLA4_9NEOP
MRFRDLYNCLEAPALAHSQTWIILRATHPRSMHFLTLRPHSLALHDTDGNSPTARVDYERCRQVAGCGPTAARAPYTDSCAAFC